MNDPSSVASSAPVVRLAIRGLPNLTDSMIAGGLYVLIAETPPARFPILAASIGTALNDELTCSVIVPSNPEMFLERIESFGYFDAPALIEAHRLNVFVTQSEFPKKMFRFGADSFVRELEQFNIPENSYLLFDQADELLSLHDISLAVDQIDILRKWFEKRRVTALLVFTRATEAHGATINALMDNLTGMARLGSDRDGLQLTFDYWQSSEGTIAARNYHLMRLDNGLYEATTRVAVSDQMLADGNGESRIEVDESEPHFFYMDPDLGSLAKQMPGVWQRVDTLVGMMHATRNTRSATSILSFQRGTNLRQLAEAVHTLRLTLGRQARIVVQEKGASLRYQNEALLLRLGINLVVHRDVPTSRLPLLLEALKGQIFNRDVDINFEAALASVLPTRLRGYLAPLRFAREVDGILDRAETLNIPCAMIVGKPTAARNMVDIIANSGLSRPGDLISSDGEFCYLFLNACPQSVMLVTLQRILGMPVDAAFDDVRFMIRREEIQPELASLARSAEQRDLPDYSSVVSTTPVAEDVVMPGETQEFPQAASAQENDALAATSAVASVAQASVSPFSGRSRVDSIFSTKNAAVAKPKPAVDFGIAKVAALPTPAVDAAIPSARSRTQAEASRFSYDTARNDQAFGKKEAPRATRSAAGARAAAAPADDVVKPVGV